MVRQLSALVILLCVAGTASAAVTVSFNEGDENGYAGTLDTWLAEGNPDTGFGEDVEISIDASEQGGVTQGMIRFTDIFGNGPGQIPTANTTIGYAELYLWADDPSAANAVIPFHRVLNTPGSNWDELSTWNSLGGSPLGTVPIVYPIQFDGVEALATPDFTIADPTCDECPFTFDVTAAVQSWLTNGPNSNLGWAATNTATDGWDFSSSEEGSEQEQPILTVIYFQTGLRADIDGNGTVNLADYTILRNNMASHLDAPISIGTNGDLNFDSQIDLADFRIFKDEFPGGAAAFEAAVAGVPEPSTALLILLAVGGLVGTRCPSRPGKKVKVG